MELQRGAVVQSVSRCNVRVVQAATESDWKAEVCSLEGLTGAHECGIGSLHDSPTGEGLAGCNSLSLFLTPSDGVKVCSPIYLRSGPLSEALPLHSGRRNV